MLAELDGRFLLIGDPMRPASTGNKPAKMSRASLPQSPALFTDRVARKGRHVAYP
jgi:hypothetical protein